MAIEVTEAQLRLCRGLASSSVRRYRLRSADFEQVLSDAYLGLVEALGRVDGREGRASFIYKYIQGHIWRGIRMRVRRNAGGDLFLVDEMDIHMGDHSDHRYDDLYEALDELPDKHRQAVELYHVHGYSQDEIAPLLDVTQMTISRWIRQSETTLRQALEAA